MTKTISGALTDASLLCVLVLIVITCATHGGHINAGGHFTLRASQAE